MHTRPTRACKRKFKARVPVLYPVGLKLAAAARLRVSFSERSAARSIESTLYTTFTRLKLLHGIPSNMFFVHVLICSPVTAKLLFGQVPRLRAVALMLEAYPELRNNASPHGDIFEFGVFTGGGLRAWVDEFAKRAIKFGQLWGFDSFKGMPDVDPNTSDPEEQRIRQRGHREVAPGQLNAMQRFREEVASVSSLDDLQRELRRIIGHPWDRTHFISGFYNESLPRLPPEMLRRMKPAFLVDIDGDWYSSTIGPWEFLLANCLVVPGSFVYYDDLQECGLGSGCGEGRAHAEVTARHHIKWERHDWRDPRRNNRSGLPIVFRVLSLRPAPGCRRRLVLQ